MNKRNRLLYMITVVCVFLALMSAIAVNYIAFYENARVDLERLGKSNLIQESDKIEEYMSKRMDILIVTADVVDYMLKNGATADDVKEFLTVQTEHYTAEIDENFTGMYGLFLGEYIDGSGWVPEKGYNPYERDWYVNAMAANGESAIVPPYLDAQTKTVLVSLSKLLYDGVSVISFDVSMNDIQEITENINIDGEGYGFVVNQQGTVVSHNDSAENGKNYLEDGTVTKEILDDVKLHGTSSFEKVIDGKVCTVFSDNIMNDWTVVLIIENSRLYSNINSVLVKNILVCTIIALCILVFCAISFAAMRKFALREIESKKKLEDLNNSIVKALARTIDAKDRYTNGHSQRVANYSVEIARRMGKSEKECEVIYYAGLLHDVGKIRVSENVINKPGKLDDKEFDQIKVHPVTGYHILKDIYEDQLIAMGAKYHHERYDGKGYPHGLKGENIPEIARIIGVADTYDAMTSNRSYRTALSQETVRAEIEKGKGTQFDPKFADIMLDIIDEDIEFNLKQGEYPERKILVVDDEPINIAVIKKMLSDKALYTVCSANNAYDALDILETNEFDLVLLDVIMPEMDGFKLFELIKEKYNVPVVIMTGEKSIDTINKVAELGIQDYISKPVQQTALKEILHSIFNAV